MPPSATLTERVPTTPYLALWFMTTVECIPTSVVSLVMGQGVFGIVGAGAPALGRATAKR